MQEFEEVKGCCHLEEVEGVEGVKVSSKRGWRRVRAGQGLLALHVVSALDRWTVDTERIHQDVLVALDGGIQINSYSRFKTKNNNKEYVGSRSSWFVCARASMFVCSRPNGTLRLRLLPSLVETHELGLTRRKLLVCVALLFCVF